MEQQAEDPKKKKPGIMSPQTERMGLSEGSTLSSPPRLQAMAQGSPLGMGMQQSMPNAADIALAQRTNSTNVGIGQEGAGQEAGGLSQMERVKDGVARRAGKEKTSIFGNQ